MPPPIQNRHDFVLLFDVTDGNPNGDPDAGNLPRIDPETGHGLVTDVALKRKVRNYVGIKHEDAPPHAIYIREGAVLQTQRADAYEGLREDEASSEEAARRFMCETFFDVRTFGAVMSTTRFNAGQVRGPVQFTFARSVNRVLPMDHTITRVASETEKRAQDGGHIEMGHKATIAYGLYRMHGFVSPHLAASVNGTGFSDDDVSLLWEALGGMFNLDRAAARGLMATRRLIVFRHSSMLGNAPAHALFERLSITTKDGVETPRAFHDFNVILDTADLHPGVQVMDLV